jgi:hypothetical protein
VIKSLPTGQAVVITKVPETRVKVVRVARPMASPPVAGPRGRAPTTCASGRGDQARQPRPHSPVDPHPQRQLQAPSRDGPELG